MKTFVLSLLFLAASSSIVSARALPEDASLAARSAYVNAVELEDRSPKKGKHHKANTTETAVAVTTSTSTKTKGKGAGAAAANTTETTTKKAKGKGTTAAANLTETATANTTKATTKGNKGKGTAAANLTETATAASTGKASKSTKASKAPGAAAEKDGLAELLSELGIAKRLPILPILESRRHKKNITRTEAVNATTTATGKKVKGGKKHGGRDIYDIYA